MSTASSKSHPRIRACARRRTVLRLWCRTWKARGHRLNDIIFGPELASCSSVPTAHQCYTNNARTVKPSVRPTAWPIYNARGLELRIRPRHEAYARRLGPYSAFPNLVHGCCGCCCRVDLNTLVNIIPILAKRLARPGGRSRRTNPRRTDEESQPQSLDHSKMSISGQGTVHHASRITPKDTRWFVVRV